MNLEDSQEECHGSSSIWNPLEARFVAGLAKHVKTELEKRKDKKSVGILTFYNRQKSGIRKVLQDMHVPVADDRQSGRMSQEFVSIRSVDGFQVSWKISIFSALLLL